MNSPALATPALLPLTEHFNEAARLILRSRVPAYLYHSTHGGSPKAYVRSHAVSRAHLIGVYTRDVNLLDLLEDMRATDYFTEEV